MSQARVALGDEFLTAYSRIPRKQQSKVSDFLKRFRTDPFHPGIHLERIHGTPDGHLHSVRIDQAYRGIVHKTETGNTFILLWVDHHDDAYAWARRRKVSIHPDTGCIQVIDAYEAEPDTPQAKEESLRLFRKLKDRHLRQFGVPQEYLNLVQNLSSEGELEALRGRLPQDAFECLEMFHAGLDIEEILQDVASSVEESVDTGDFDTALDRDGSKRFFYVVENEEELAGMLAAPLDKWRVFLHPTQRRLVERDWNGPVRVLGSAGTGKTVAAMHRARWLAMNRFTESTDRILFTTFTKNLAGDIRENLKTITPPEAMARIEVTNLDEWVWTFLKRNGYSYGFALRDVTKGLWGAALVFAPDGFEHAFFLEEWERVILPQGIDAKSSYLTCSRVGRGTRLTRKQRAEVWQVFEEYRRLLDEAGLREPVDAVRDARHIVEKNPGMLPYRAVVVDEAQDMGPQEFMLIRHLARGDTNSIFITGDAHQRIYGKKATLIHHGIDIRGRGKTLRINYRTSEENRNWATKLIEGFSFDDLDGGIDDPKGCRSLIHGPSPTVNLFPSFAEEMDFIVQQLVPLLAESGVICNVCITARVTSLLDVYARELENRGIATFFISKDRRDDRTKPGVRMATMHRVKGLEFDTMIVAGVNEGIVPLSAAIAGSDEATVQEQLKNERALLYVAVTRARKNVVITGVEPGSVFLCHADA